MYRTFVILRHTFFEAIFQPIYSLLLALGVAMLLVLTLLPFFTLGEDAVMFMAVGLDIILLLVLISTLFATSKSIFEEIEDRTMLTLMSKPVRKIEVLVGKYLGITLSALLGVAVLGLVLGLCLWWRIPNDYGLRRITIDDRDLASIWGYRLMHLNGLIPSLALLWLQISVLAAVGVALSTRLPLVVNLPVVIVLYLAGNLTRFLFPLEPSQPLLYKGLAHVLGTVLPYLENFDLRPLTVYRHIAVAQFVVEPNAVPPGQIWGYLLLAVAYAVCYSFFALVLGMWLFQRRELGGSEG